MNVNFANSKCSIKIGRYYNDNTSIQLYDTEDGMPVATASVNVKEKLLPEEVIIKDYSENEGIYNALLKAGVILPSHNTYQTGNVISPISFINKQNINF